ncbi:MAG: nodulation protein NfeD [Bacteroidetes bacterium]|nr:nodulation protein NfeD [Bacteroidota bacterium]
MIRKRFTWIQRSVFSLCLLTFLLIFTSLSYSQKVLSIHIEGAINPSSAEYIHNAIEESQKMQAACLIIHLNTPGGLLESTRKIVGDIFQSTVPVVVYVSPEGSRAASAGVFITMAANISAMAMGTNIGAAHPVTMQGNVDSIMNMKMTNDAVAFIRTIAEKRGKNVDWAEEAVRNSVSITEQEALEKNVIDLVAIDDIDLLRLLDGREVKLSSGTVVLHTKNAKVVQNDMGFFAKILDKMSDPNIAYLLIMLGFYGILFELFSPGAIFPGIVGVISLVLGFYAMSMLPVNYAGIALILFGIVLFLLEIKITSHGILTIGGIISVLMGSMILFRSSPLENIASLSWTVIISTTAVTALFFLFVVGIGLKALKAKPVSGASALIGKTAQTISALDPDGLVKIMGETWKATAVADNIQKDEKVIIKSVQGFTLFVDLLKEDTI